MRGLTQLQGADFLAYEVRKSCRDHPNEGWDIDQYRMTVTMLISVPNNWGQYTQKNLIDLCEKHTRIKKREVVSLKGSENSTGHARVCQVHRNMEDDAEGVENGNEEADQGRQSNAPKPTGSGSRRRKQRRRSLGRAALSRCSHPLRAPLLCQLYDCPKERVARKRFCG